MATSVVLKSLGRARTLGGLGTSARAGAGMAARRGLSTKAREATCFIDGIHVTAQTGGTFENVNPATGESLSPFGCAGEKEVNDAVAAARRAFPIWSGMSGQERGRILLRAAELVKERTQDIAELEVIDNGKPLAECVAGDIPTCTDALEYFGGRASSLLTGTYHTYPNNDHAYTRREPVGVCAGIGAWNYPFQIACWKSAPALACGNTMVFKPSELTPLTATLLAEAYKDAGVPDGVFNVVQGHGATGRLLTTHRGVDKVSFTGEVGTGKAIVRDTADTLKKVTLELGGKSPLIIFADCDLDNAVVGAMKANFYSQGEVCSNGTRVFVEESIHDEFVNRLVRKVQALKVGDPFQEDTQVGALINEEHMHKVLGFVRSGVSDGAKLLCGGERVDVPNHSGGFFVSPAVFAGCTDDMEIVRREIFGPVASVLSFKTEEEAVTRANDTDLGLAGGVFTKDLNRAHRVIGNLQAGSCYVNNYNFSPMEIPFGGYKQSGIGRENGAAVIEHYTQVKSVFVQGDEPLAF